MAMAEQTVISAFNHEVLQRVHTLDSEISLALLYTDEKAPVGLAKELGCTGLHPFFPAVTKELVWKCKEEGLQVIPWTVNFEEEMLRLLGLMVDGIITDVPPLLLGLLYPEGGF
jgi:glycerophosphoryl diester phosphodiesterase